MVLFFTTTLLLSILGIFALFLIKSWELRTSKLLLASARPSVGSFFYRAAVWVEGGLPALIQSWVRRGALMTSSWVHRLIARGILIAERGLEHSLWRLRHSTRPSGGTRDVSHFLREVAEHKKRLARESVGEEK